MLRVSPLILDVGFVICVSSEPVEWGRGQETLGRCQTLLTVDADKSTLSGAVSSGTRGRSAGSGEACPLGLTQCSAPAASVTGAVRTDREPRPAASM